MFEASCQFSVLSLAFRMVDNEEDDKAPVDLLTLFSGIKGSFQSGFRFYPADHFSVKISYLYNFTRISKWDQLFTASDNLIFTLTYGF
jgi:hypothetical protein